MILNEEIDIEKARSYSAIIRSVAQLVTSEVQKARIEQRHPDLGLEDK